MSFILGSTTLANSSVLTVPVGTTAQRPASPANGHTRINSNTNMLECYYNGSWTNIASVGFTAETQINTNSMTHSIVNPGGTGLQGQGSTNISTYGATAPSLAPNSSYYSNFNFMTHGGHSGSNSYPMYWAVHLGTAKAVNQLKCFVHQNCWGYFLLEGSNDSGSSSGFATSGTWTALTLSSSDNGSNNQNMGGNGSGLADGTALTFNYSNNTGYLAYRIRVIDSSRPTQAQGTFYGGSACYSWQMNRT